MKLLLDTHAFLWFIEGSPNLSNVAQNAITNPTNQKFLSIASLWEISIKASIGRLELHTTVTELAERHIYGNNIELLAIFPNHPESLTKLPFHHKDPFDRLIIAQAQTEDIPVITKDSFFQGYAVDLLW